MTNGQKQQNLRSGIWKNKFTRVGREKEGVLEMGRQWKSEMGMGGWRLVELENCVKPYQHKYCK